MSSVSISKVLTKHFILLVKRQFRKEHLLYTESISLLFQYTTNISSFLVAMDVELDLGRLKYIYVVKTLCGLTTLCLETLGRSIVKTVVAGLLLTLFVVEFSHWIFHELTTDRPRDTQMMMIRSAATTFILLCFQGALSDYKTLYSSWLEVLQVEKKLDFNRIGTGRFSFERILSVVLPIFLVCQSFAIVLASFDRMPDLLFTKYFTGPLFYVAVFIQCSEIVIFVTKLATVQKQIAKAIWQLHLAYTNTNVWAVQRSLVESESLRRFKSLIPMQRALFHSELQFRLCNSFVLVFSRLSVEFWFPLVVLTRWDSSYIFGARLISLPILFVSIVVAYEQLRSARLSTRSQLVTTLFSCDSRRLRRSAKHQLLANIHRSSPFSVRLFDVHLGIFCEVLNIAMLVVTTLLST